jgi:DNA polymerase-3 subunit alpha
MVATINNSGGFYRPEYYLHEARMHGGIIHPPDINKSYAQNFIQGKHIYLGFMMLHAFESQNAKKIIRERERNGLFSNLDDFIDRVSIGLEQLILLIKVNAFQFCNPNKRELLWEAYMKVHKIEMEEQVQTLFKSEKINYKTPVLTSSMLEDAFDEIQYLDFPLCDPFALLAEPVQAEVFAKDLYQYVNKKVTVYGYYVTVKKTVTSKSDLMYFGTFVDEKGDHIDTVHFPQAARKNLFRGRGIYRLTGKVTEEFDCVTIEVDEMEKLAIVQDPRYAEEKKTLKI